MLFCSTSSNTLEISIDGAPNTSANDDQAISEIELVLYSVSISRNHSVRRI